LARPKISHLRIDNRLLWVDLSEPFNQTKFKFGSTTKPLELVSQDGDALVPDPAEDKFYVFGGRYATWNTSSNYFQKPPARNTGDLWLYDGSKRQWTLQETTGSKIQRITMGAATVDYNTGIIYYVGGRYDNWVVRDFAATVYVDGLLTVDTSQPTPTWTNKTIPIDSASIYEGFLQYVPLGKEGILVRFGGWRFPKGSLNPGGVLVSEEVNCE
jgi:hypothetical protein